MWAGCVAAVLLRALLYVAGAPAVLEERLQLSTPLTSYANLVEGIFLMQSGISPYTGGTCRHPPLLLLLLAPLSRAAHFATVVVIDLATACLLKCLAAQYRKAKESAGPGWAEPSMKLKDDGTVPSVPSSGIEDLLSPDFVGLSYLFNPFTIGSCLALSFQNLHHLVVCAAIYLAATGKPGVTAVGCAVMLYVFPITSAVMLVPCTYLCFCSSRPAGNSGQDMAYVRSKDTQLLDTGFVFFALKFLAAVGLLLACAFYGSVAGLGGDTAFLEETQLAVLRVADLTPNTGLFWYLFIQVFERFRLLFNFVFHAHLLFYVVPLQVKIGRHRPLGPWTQCGVSVGLCVLFKPYPTACDYGLMLSVMLMQAELINESANTFQFLLSALVLFLCMFTTMEAVWLTRNAGNANYLYNMALLINVFGPLLLSEWLKAGMRLRRRQHLFCFCRGVVSDMVESAMQEKPQPGVVAD